MFNKMHLMEYPTGRWGFVGKVHESLSGRTFPTEEVAILAARFVELYMGGLPITQTLREKEPVE